MKYYSTREMVKILNVTGQTLRNWDSNGKLVPHHKTDSGYRYYSEEQVNKFLGINTVKKNRKIIGYCRVSSNKQKDDLERQIVTVFSCRLQGKRANKAKKILKELISDDSIEEDKVKTK